MSRDPERQGEQMGSDGGHLVDGWLTAFFQQELSRPLPPLCIPNRWNRWRRAGVVCLAAGLCATVLLVGVAVMRQPGRRPGERAVATQSVATQPGGKQGLKSVRQAVDPGQSALQAVATAQPTRAKRLYVFDEPAVPVVKTVRTTADRTWLVQVLDGWQHVVVYDPVGGFESWVAMPNFELICIPVRSSQETTIRGGARPAPEGDLDGP
jgi:hypothetical protein